MTKPELRWQKATQWDCNSPLALENDSHDIHDDDNNDDNDDDSKDDIEDDNDDDDPVGLQFVTGPER